MLNGLFNIPQQSNSTGLGTSNEQLDPLKTLMDYLHQMLFLSGGSSAPGSGLGSQNAGLSSGSAGGTTGSTGSTGTSTSGLSSISI